MNLIQPRTTQGVMELLPGEQIAFAKMLDTIRSAFERFGFVPIETPVFELTKVLLTKSGGETEKQVYFVESTGSREKKSEELPELALRFDLTVPLARYVAQHENQLNFPFRRYQMQRVYRGERAQKGRYREFYQCDIDVVGKDTLPLSYDAEVAAVIHEILVQLKFGDFTIRVNNRKLLKGVLDAQGVALELQPNVLHEIDRLDKMKREDVVERMVKAGLTAEAAGALLDVLTAKETSAATLAGLESKFGTNEGFVELKQVYESMIALGVSEKRVRVSPSTVRGLDYYTGTVYETFLDGAPGLGSICSGGRYENLAGYYTKSKLPGVGISIGLTRLFEQLLELKLLPTTPGTPKVLGVNADPALRDDYFAIAKELRAAGINTEVYGPKKDVGKQYDYAQRCGVPLAVVMNPGDKAKGTVLIKRVTVAQDSADKQRIVARDALISTVQELLGK